MMSGINYEVNLTVKSTIFNDYLLWLKSHVSEMLKFDGFSSVTIGIVQQDDLLNRYIRVNYYVDTEAQLHSYLNNFASQVRKHAIDKFGDQFTVTRRVIMPVLTING